MLAKPLAGGSIKIKYDRTHKYVINILVVYLEAISAFSFCQTGAKNRSTTQWRSGYRINMLTLRLLVWA